MKAADKSPSSFSKSTDPESRVVWIQTTRDSGSVDFEKLLGDLSAAFIRVPVAEIDLEIERWLQQIVLALDVDRSTVVQLDPTDGGVYATHQWAREGVITPDR